MANQKVSGMTPVSTVLGTDILPLVRGSSNLSTTYDILIAGISSNDTGIQKFINTSASPIPDKTPLQINVIGDATLSGIVSAMPYDGSGLLFGVSNGVTAAGQTGQAFINTFVQLSILQTTCALNIPVYVNTGGAFTTVFDVGCKQIGITVQTGASSQVLAYVSILAFTSSGAVQSVFGRTGAVVAQTNDYNITQIENAGTAAQADVGVAEGNVPNVDSNGQLIAVATDNVLVTSPVSGATNPMSLKDTLQDIYTSSSPSPLTYLGTWAADSNTPTLSNPPTGAVNTFYAVINAGAQLGIDWLPGDLIINSGASWERIPYNAVNVPGIITCRNFNETTIGPNQAVTIDTANAQSSYDINVLPVLPFTPSQQIPVVILISGISALGGFGLGVYGPLNISLTVIDASVSQGDVLYCTSHGELTITNSAGNTAMGYALESVTGSVSGTTAMFFVDLPVFGRTTGVSGINSITSTGSTIDITAPTGPDVNIEVNAGLSEGQFPQLTANGLPAVGSGNTLVTDPTTSTDDTPLKTTLSNIYGAITTGNSPFKKAQAFSAINVNISNPGVDTFDGITLNIGDYLLLTAQTLGATNGIYIFNGVSSELTIAPIMNTWGQVVGSEISIPPSTTYITGSVWRNTNNTSGTFGTDIITFMEIGSGSGVNDITSLDETCIVTNSTGPTVNVEVNAGLTAGTFPRLTATGLPAVGSSDTLVTDPTTSTINTPLGTTLDNIYAEVTLGNSAFKKAQAVSLININGGSPGTSTFDGITLNVGDYLLLTAQNTAANNGIYIFNGPTSNVIRAPIMDTWADVVGSEVSIPPSTTYPNGSIWRNTNSSTGTLGTTAITFSAVVSDGYVAGTGIDITGDTIAIDNTVVTSTGPVTAGWTPQYTGTGNQVTPVNIDLSNVLRTSSSLSEYNLVAASATSNVMNPIPNGLVGQILEWGASGPFWNNGGAGTSTPYFWLYGTQTSLVDACAIAGFIFVSVNNTDTNASITLTQDTTWVGLGDIVISLHKINLNTFNLTVINCNIVLDGVHDASGYGFYDAGIGFPGVLSGGNSTFDNSASNTTGDTINASNVIFSTDNRCKFYSGSAPNTMINWNAKHSGFHAYTNGIASIDLFYENNLEWGYSNTPSADGFILVSGGAGYIQGTFTIGTPPTPNLILTMSGDFPDYSPVKVSVADGVSTLPAPLSAGATYFVINVSAGVIQLASSYENAVASTPISLTTSGTGTFTIFQAQQLINCRAGSCVSDITVSTLGCTNSQIPYFTLGGNHKITVVQIPAEASSSVVVEFNSENNTNGNYQTHSLQNSNLGPLGLIIPNFTENFEGQFLVQGNMFSDYRNYANPASDILSWIPTITNNLIYGTLEVYGFGNQNSIQNFPTIDNISADTINVSQMDRINMTNIKAMNVNINNIYVVNASNWHAENLTVTNFNIFTGSGFDLNGIVSFTPYVGDVANLTLTGCIGDGIITIHPNITKYFAANYSNY